MNYLLCAGRAAAADNLWVPPPTFVDRRTADGIFVVYFFSCNFRNRRLKKRSSENFDRMKFFRESFGDQRRAATTDFLDRSNIYVNHYLNVGRKAGVVY